MAWVQGMVSMRGRRRGVERGRAPGRGFEGGGTRSCLEGTGSACLAQVLAVLRVKRSVV